MKPMGFIRTVPEKQHLKISMSNCSEGFRPFTFEEVVLLVGDPNHKRTIRILRDTAAAQSFFLTNVLPLSEALFTGSYSIAQGIDMSFIKVPLHHVLLN